MKKITYILFTLLILTISACGEPANEFDYGKLNGTVYTNSYFKIRVEIPENWFFVDKDGRTEMVAENIDRLTKDNPSHNKQMHEAKDLAALLFTLFKYPPDTLLEVNPNITITATKIASYPRLKNMDYAIKLGQESLKEANPAFTFSNHTFEKKFDKIVFKGFNASLTIDSMTANYDMYLANFDDYNLNLTVSYKDGKQKDELYTILQTMEIN